MKISKDQILFRLKVICLKCYTWSLICKQAALLPEYPPQFCKIRGGLDVKVTISTLEQMKRNHQTKYQNKLLGNLTIISLFSNKPEF